MMGCYCVLELYRSVHDEGLGYVERFLYAKIREEILICTILEVR
jgi:hypothetical protein